MMGLELNIFARLMMLFTTITALPAYIPQLVRMVKRKQSDDISYWGWALWIAQYAIMTIYAVIYTNDIMLVVGYFVELMLCTATLVLAIKYRQPSANLYKSIKASENLEEPENN